MVFMINAHGLLVLLGVIVVIAVFLAFILRINGDKTRRIMELSSEQQKNDKAETVENVFEMLKLVRNSLEASKISLQHIIPKNTNVMTKKSGLLPRVESSATKNDLVKSSNFVMEAEIAEDTVIQQTGGADEGGVGNILEHKIAKATENILGLNDALKRLLAAKELVRGEDPSDAIDDASGLSSIRQYLPFFLGDELYAVGLATVQEALQATRLFVDPSTPEKIRSAINLDGSVVPVIDLSIHFGGEMTKVGPNTLIVILLLRVDGQLQKVGIKVDGVGKIILVNQASVVRSHVKATSVRNDFVRGEFKTEHHSITLLDFNQELALKHILRSHSQGSSLPNSLSKKCDVSELLH